MTETVIPVRGDSTYAVIVGHRVLDRVTDLIGGSGSKVALLHPPTLRDLADRVMSSIAAADIEVLALEVPDGEAAKTSGVVDMIWNALGEEGFTRTDVVVGLGGGATTDLAGFIGATWLRGVRTVLIPTTLLAMVDAAVGGKTGINTSAGKNLVGAFHPPAGVLCDLDCLATLPRADLLAGMAEVVKGGFIVDPRILDIVESDPVGCTQPGDPRLRELIERKIQVKADVVAGDLRERIGPELGREVLNYGHTFGHAVERIENYRWRHGDAISVGMVYVAELARIEGLLSDADVARHRSILTSLELPVSYVPGRWDDLLAAMRVDKKARGDMLRFVVLDGIGKPRILEGPSEESLRAAYEEVSS
jgi:3-dehydroquinate synthase